VATGVEAATSSHIEKIIEKLAQLDGLEVLATGMILEGITTVTREPSSQSILPTVFGSSAWQEDKYSPYTPILIIIANIDVMIAESTRIAQVKEPVASTGAEDSALQTSTAEPSTTEFVPAAVASEATTVTVIEMPATTQH